MALVTLAYAKSHLQITSDDDNDEVQRKVEHASALVLERCGSTAYWRLITATWTDQTVPGSVQAAVLVLLTHLWENRGNDMAVDEKVWASVERLTAMKRDRVIA
jgi:hypothetical protein